MMPSEMKEVQSSPKLLFSGRFRREQMAYLVIILATVIGTTLFLVFAQVTDIATQTHLLSFSLLVAVVLLLILIFFVGKQVIALWIERKQKQAGAQLHLRLAVLFAVITAIPSILVALFAVSLIDYSLRGWFAERISTAVEESVEVANAYFDEHARSVRGQILTMANDINREATQLVNNQRRLNEYISNQTVLRNLSEAVIIDGTGRIVGKSQFAFSISFSKISDELLAKARQGDVIILTSKENNKIQAIVKLNSFVDAYLLVGRFIDSDVLSALDRTKLAADDYQSLSLQQFDLQISFAAMFFVISLLLVLSALWVGLILANSLVEPLVNIIGVAEQVRTGNLKERVPAIDHMDEISRLGSSFNRMLDEVASSREQLVTANKQLDARREFTEAVLGGVSSGVIGLDKKGVITLPNQTACALLGKSLNQLIGKKLTTIQPEFQTVFDNMENIKKAQPDSQIIINNTGQQQILRARIRGEKIEGRLVGYVLTFDDVTDFLAAQRKAAWADVARRIAHEIKNPLTPIALATDRLMKKYRPENEEDARRFEEYLNIIGRQVDDIGRMVEEFSNFARMPAPVLKRTDFNRLIEEQLTVLRADSKVRVVVDIPEPQLSVWIDADAGLMRQLVMNLTKNALENMQENQIKDPCIEISLKTDPQRAVLTITDNGSGFSGDDMQKYLEPYMTTRERGTGLGLAIVHKIISDHNGHILLSNHPEKGAMVTISIPLAIDGDEA